MFSTKTRPSFSRHRRLLSAVAVLLLLMMQQEANWHALQHDGQRLGNAHEQSLQVPTVVTVCAQCALLAGGASVLPKSIVTPVLATGTTWRVAFDFSSRPAALPSSYSSRAPPVSG